MSRQTFGEHQSSTPYQSNEEIQEVLLQELENLFDKPCLIPVVVTLPSDAGKAPVPTPFKVGLEKDYNNSFLITNPSAIFKVFQKDQFLALPETTQGILLDRLDDILLKCSHNSLILTDHIVQANPSTIIRICQTAILSLKGKSKAPSQQLEEHKTPTSASNTGEFQGISPQTVRHHSSSSDKDFLQQVLNMTLKLSSKSSTTTKKLIELVRKITGGRRFFRCHVEFIYQYLKVKCAKLSQDGKSGQALAKVDTALKMMQAMFEQKFESGPTNFFYFSGYLSGIQINTKQIPQSEFTKGFAAAMWFSIHDNTLQDDKNLPVLFNCFFQGFGGFECYFNQRKLFYRILPKHYTPPNIDSNGVLIGEFQPKKWYFFAIEHERPFMTRPQFTAIINDKQVVTLPMDYPKIDKNAKISMVVICQNFVGQLSSFMLFKDSIGNSKKLIQMGHSAYEHGIFTQQQLQSLRTDIFDQKIIDKLLIFFTPDRTSNKTVYDCIEMRDGELMINSGVCNTGPKSKLFFTGGLNSLLPALELISGISLLNKTTVLPLDTTINEYLKLLISVLSQRSFVQFEQEHSNFFSVLFLLLTKLPYSAVNSQTIQNLADIRFQIGEQTILQEQFFYNLMMSSDYWINTGNIEVINEYWLFVKAIYQQNPVAYNKIFSIQNLIDLMVKISDIKDGHCCQFHLDTFLIFYQGVEETLPQQTPQGNTWVVVNRQSSVGEKVQFGRPSVNEIAKSDNPFYKQSQGPKPTSKIHDIEKYLAPIAGVLEGVLTSGGNEVLDQIQNIAKALTIKSSPCFHLQMLKLLKVILLDSKDDRQCASPADFASYLLKAKGLQILLYLCSNSSFDVKSMCVKLIDVLSSHTSLIKIAIDPDVITYLCSIVLPRQMMEAAASFNKKSQAFSNLVLEQPLLSLQNPPDHHGSNQQQYQIMDDVAETEHPLEDSQDLENQMNQLLAQNAPVITKKKEKKINFGTDLIFEDEKPITASHQDEESYELPSRKNAKDRLSLGAFQDTNSYKENQFDGEAPVYDDYQDPEEEEYLQLAKPPPPAPTNRGNIRFDFDSDSNEPEKKLNQTQKNYFFDKNPTIAEVTNEDDEYDDDGKDSRNADDYEEPELFLSREPASKKVFMNTQKIPSRAISTKSKAKPAFRGLELNIESNTEFKSKGRNKPPPMAMEDEESTQIAEPRKRGIPKFESIKGDDPTNFANENVLSKSNLRQPKSFNFGFPEEGSSSDDEQEEGKQEDDDIKEYFQQSFSQQDVKRKKQPISRPARQQLGLDLGEDKTRRNLIIGGTTGATSDEVSIEKVEESQEEEEKVPSQRPQAKKSAVISYQKNAKLFTNANLKLNIDTEAINELFNYGGEKGQIMMSEDEEYKQLEMDIEELASMCIAAMNRKKSTDPIKYENKREKTTFECKYLKGESEVTKQKKPRQQFMTPQSVRGIKKIEFSMSQEERNAALENSKDQLTLGVLNESSSEDFSDSKGFSLKNDLLMSNTILEENSQQSSGSSKSSSGNKLTTINTDINFPGLLNSSDPFNQPEVKEDDRSHKQNITFAQLPGQLMIDEEIENSSPRRTSELIMYNHNLEDNNDIAMKDEIMEQTYGVQLQEDHYTKELENLYTSCLEWIISRAPSSLYENIVIDECDKVGYQPAIQLLLTLVTYSNNIIRQRALTDMEMLAKWDHSNGMQIMMHPLFHTWLLDLLMPYQDLANRYSKLQGSALAVYDIACKLHTLLLKSACTNHEEEAYKKINFVARWPSIVQMQLQQGVKDRSENDIDTAHKVSRVLLTSLVSSLKDEIARSKPVIGKNAVSPTWHNLVYISYVVEEMILGSHLKEINKDNDGKDESGQDFNGQPLFKWIHDEGYLLYYLGSNEKSLWAEWPLLEAVFTTIESIYPDWTLKSLSTRQGDSVHSVDDIYKLLEKTSSADEFNSIVEILVQDQTPYKAQQSQFQPQPVKPPSKKGILGNVLGSHFKLSSSEKQQQQQQQLLEQQAIQQQQQSKGDKTFMGSILNMLCIGLTQSDTKELVQLWLERFERFTKFLMIVSESWKSRLVNTVYSIYQKQFTEVITFAMTFLFHEIHATNRTSPKNQSSMNFNSSSQSSPKDQQKFNNLYAKSLKSIMIFFINILEYSKIKYTPSQLEMHVTACRYIFNNVLVKSYSNGQVFENLISFRDLTRFKQSDYEDFPECFYHDEWKVTFFNNETIKLIVKKQFNLELLINHQNKRRSYASHYMETQSSNDKTKEDILRRMQLDTIEVIGFLSEEEFERKNRVTLLNDNFIRQQGHHWRQVKKSQTGGKGMWKGEITRLKMSSYRLNDGTRAIMEDCYGPQRFEYFDNVPELEVKIFGAPTIEKKRELDLLMLDQHSLKGLSDNKNLVVNTVTSNEDEDNQKLTDEDFDDEDIEDLSPFGMQKQGRPSKLELHKTSNFGRPSALGGQQKEQIISFFSRMLNAREKASLKKQYVALLKNHIFGSRLGKFKEIISEMKCEILKPFFKRPGILTLTSQEIVFFDDLTTGASQEVGDNIFFFKYAKKDDSLYYKIIPLQDIKEVQRRRWLGRKTALEVFLIDGRSYTLNFSNTEDREQFAKKVLRQRNQKCSNLKYYDTLEPRRILKKRELTDKWMQWKISNFEYISLLNQLAGRSYNDLSQYPVFPWIIIDYLSSAPPDITQIHNAPMGAPQGFRDLNRNMQLLGSAERQAEFKKKFDDLDSFETLQERFHCGSHYSNPGIVLHYMSRVSPYIDALVQLHGKSLDTPDRGFHSIHESLQGALNDHADVRELIPEFFFCPEMFINQNRINFGVKQDGISVDDVQLPQWCQNDPYLFVIYLREAFESQYVSQNLGGWIDYIFGFKQKDQEAEKSLNTYSRMTYEDGIDIDNVEDPTMKQGYQEQIYNYGQTPSQLFQKMQKHPSRLPKGQALKFNSIVDSQAKIKVYKPVLVQQTNPKGGQIQQPPSSQVLISQEAILKAKFIDESTIVGLSKDGSVTYFFWLSKAHELNPNTPFTCCEDKKRKFDNRTKANGIDFYDRSIKRFDFPLLILNSQKCILRGGFWGGKIIICPIEGINNEAQSSLNVHQSTVTAMVSTSNERTIISGSKNGDVVIWTYVGPGHDSQWKVRKHICDHEAMITFIHINEEMSMYLTCSFDASVNLYNLHSDKFIRTFQHPNLSPVHSAVLTQTPLPAVCFFSREDHYWYSYSLNNSSHMLEKQREEASHIISPHVIRDSHFMERLVYGTEKGYLIFRSLPLLKQTKKQQVSISFPVLSIVVSFDRRFLLVGCGDGGLNVVTEPFGSFAPQISNITAQQTIQTSNLLNASYVSLATTTTSHAASQSTRPSIVQQSQSNTYRE